MSIPRMAPYYGLTALSLNQSKSLVRIFPSEGFYDPDIKVLPGLKVEHRDLLSRHDSTVLDMS